jgi:flavorubredoxin
MSKVIVIYDSKTGFTKKMAEAVVEGVKDVTGVDVELVKVGTPFSISKLDSADALILGSPTVYGNVTQDMNTLIQSVRAHKESQRLKLSGKIGGVFGSYGWDGGWVVEILREEIEDLGIKVVANPVSLVDGQGGRYEIYISEEALNKCRTLGRTVAKKAVNKG